MNSVTPSSFELDEIECMHAISYLLHVGILIFFGSLRQVRLHRVRLKQLQLRNQNNHLIESRNSRIEKASRFLEVKRFEVNFSCCYF